MASDDVVAKGLPRFEAPSRSTFREELAGLSVDRAEVEAGEHLRHNGESSAAASSNVEGDRLDWIIASGIHLDAEAVSLDHAPSWIGEVCVPYDHNDAVD